MKNIVTKFIIIAMTFCFSMVTMAQSQEEIVPYKDFFPLKNPVTVSTNPSHTQMDVIYFFSYSNAAEYADVDKAFTDWASKVPVQINPIMTTVYTGKKTDFYDAFLFFGLQDQNKEAIVHQELIKAIASGLRYTDLDGTLLPWLGSHGVNISEFQKDVGTNTTKNLVLRTPDVAKMYEVNTSPTVVVDGKIAIPYKVGMTPQKYITIVNTVITYLWKERQSKKSNDIVL